MKSYGLEQTRVLIIAGPPGVGKTTLAEMLAWAYIGEEWEFEAIRSLDDGFAAIVDTKKQIWEHVRYDLIRMISIP